MTMAKGIEKIDLLEWGWHKVGDPTKPKGGLLWGNPEWNDFWVAYDEFEHKAFVLYRYARGGSDECEQLNQIYAFMNTHNDYEHEWND